MCDLNNNHVISPDGRFIYVSSDNGHLYYRYVDHKAIPVFASDGSLIEWHGMSWIRDAPHMTSHQTVELQGIHVRAARALLGMTARELAEAAGVSFSTFRRIEDDVTSIRHSALDKIEKELLRRGVSFSTASNGMVSVSKIGPALG
ncbi:helix-turn-helix domain-containing protein [Rhizobium sp. TRM95796]|uniref:helix-turn-helix domain-containing protein n=1 Tax=Rhizobium sp. TRM95796 TaxID=2979862 RepID=UPI0021E8F488|nr:helix-turn-helix transcriptional regulator [Rhizobium sp. TRM95796]MCV3768721.1 helix-turn-helix transcriptional regulator [Rhizobium sp. TRM95796]